MAAPTDRVWPGRTRNQRVFGSPAAVDHPGLIALGFAFVSVVVVLTLGIMVDAPFLDERRDLAHQFGVGRAVTTAAWYVGCRQMY